MSFGSMMIDVVSRAIEHDVDAADFQEFQAAADADLQHDQTAPDGWEAVETSTEDSLAIVPGDAYRELEAEAVQEAESPDAWHIQAARFSAPRKALAEAVKAVAAGVPRRCNKFELGKLRLCVNGTVRMESTDLEQSVALSTDFYHSGEADILIDPARLQSALKSIKSATSVDVEIVADKVKIGAFTIPGDDPSEFPRRGWDFSPADVLAECFVDGRQMADAINRTAFATDAESTRYALGGIFLEISAAHGITLAATDSRRLSVVELGKPQYFKSDDLIVSYVVPLATMERLAKSIGKKNPTVRIVAHNTPRYGQTRRALEKTKTEKTRKRRSRPTRRARFCN